MTPPIQHATKNRVDRSYMTPPGLLWGVIQIFSLVSYMTLPIQQATKNWVGSYMTPPGLLWGVTQISSLVSYMTPS